MARAATWAGLLLIAGLAGCDKAPTGYFPLEPGLNWKYRVTTVSAGETRRSLFGMTNLGTDLLDGEQVHIRRSSSGTDYYFKHDATGVYRVAKRSVVEKRPRHDEEPRYVLKYPLASAGEWAAPSHVYVLHRVHPYEESLTRGVRFVMTYRVEATDARVTVPAGRFEDCVLVRGEGLVTVYSDAVRGFTEIPITTLEWYARGVGLVRLERSENLHTTVFAGGSKVFELDRFGY